MNSMTSSIIVVLAILASTAPVVAQKNPEELLKIVDDWCDRPGSPQK